MPPHRASTRPPFCPNPRCDSRAESGPWRFKRKGFFLRAHKPHKVQRYLCQHCGRNFSAQTFRPSYWLRYTTLLEPLFHRLVGCSGYRQIARELSVSHSTVRRQTERLGRHCLLLHQSLRPRNAPTEPVVLDGFRSFEHSQYWPLDVHLLVGLSHHVYDFNDAELRRSGSMRPSQRRKRALLEGRYGRPDPQATRKRVEELLRRVVPPGESLHLLSDEHPDYRRALKRLPDRRFVHETTPSRKARTPTNPLFPVNLADLLLRHSSANHKRETLAFSKRRQGMLYRLAVWVVWRNTVKPVSENRKDPPPAVRLGLIDRALSVREILAQRLFPDRAKLSGWLAECYFGRIPTRAIPNCVAHEAKYAV